MEFTDFERTKQTELYSILARAIETLEEEGLEHNDILARLEISEETFVDICEYL